jgi:hypothetical protein
MKKMELLVKSREAMMSAVQIYNNPQITFKSESFISLAIISWTYLLHCYYSNNNIDYRYFHNNGKKKIYDRTKHGAYKHWELERCLDSKKSPIDIETTKNLKFLIGLRHEIEHQMTKKIDKSISAKLQACSINYNYFIKELFGEEFGVDKQLGLAIQFSPIEPDQKEQLLNNDKLSENINNFISEFEDNLTDDEIRNPKYAYRVLFTRLNANRKGQADQVIEFIPEGSERAKQLNKTHMLIKETEKKKYLSKEVVSMMHDKGYAWFNTQLMTNYWKNELKSRDKYGLYITNNQWMWYENWIPMIENYCERIINEDLSNGEKKMYAKDIVQLMVEKGYKKFNIYWLKVLWKYEMNIDRHRTAYGYFERNSRFVWKKEWIPVVESYCKRNAIKFGKLNTSV